MKSTIVLLMSLILIYGCKVDHNKNNYLKKVLDNLDQIKSATYYYKIESYAPGDSMPTVTMHRYYKEYCNPADSTIGASYVVLMLEDTTRMTYCYDGKMMADVYEEDKIMVIDSFQNNTLLHRPVVPPFFNYTKSIIKYALETKDNISTSIEDFGDSVLFRLTIIAAKQVHFFGKPYYSDSPYGYGEEVSRYYIWISKSSDLPYRLRCEWSHDMFVVTCRNAEFNKNKISDFNASEYFPRDLTTVEYGKFKVTKKNDLEGKVVPFWSLKDANNNQFSINKLQSKVFMIEFTSVSCGPCRSSIPFLKLLASEYSKKDFDFVSVESWNRNSNVLKAYQEKNDINYKFLISTDDVTKYYQIYSVPVFYILDKNRVIKKVIIGYGKGTTDKEIRDAINELI